MQFSSYKPNYSRILIFFIILISSFEIFLRSTMIFPWVPHQRYQSTNGRLIQESIDQVRQNAKPGDWVLIGDSILKGVKSPASQSPSELITAHFAKRNEQHQVWDLTLFGANPPVMAAMLARLGVLPGVTLFTNVSQKLTSTHNYKELYWAEIWDFFSRWESTSPELKQIFSELLESNFTQFEKDQADRTYGDTISERYLNVWMNSLFSVFSLDYWLVHFFTGKRAPELLSSILIHNYKPIGRVYSEITEWDYLPFPFSEANDVQAYLKTWYGRMMGVTEPNWRAYLLYLDLLKRWGDHAVLSLNTVSLLRTKNMKREMAEPIESAYKQLKDQAVQVGIKLIEPNTFVPQEGYADEDHFRSVGNQIWMSKLLERL
jgi:hypothetical protein